MPPTRIDGGYILLARRLRYSDIWESPPLFLKLFIFFLLEASHRDHGTLKRGQLHTNLPTMCRAVSHKVGYGRKTPKQKQVRNAYEVLKGMGMISTTKTSKGVIVTIENYEMYQNPGIYEAQSCDFAKGLMKGLTKGQTRRGEQTPDTTPSLNGENQDSPEHEGANTTGAKGRALGRIRGEPINKNGKEGKRRKEYDASRKRARPSKTNPDVKVFIDWWEIRYQENIGSPYYVNGGKDGALVKRLLGTFPIADLTRAAEAFLTDPNPWPKDAGRTISIFAQQINTYAAKTTPKPEQPIINHEEAQRRGLI